ncbi:MAG: hypothetical protein Q7R58_00445 [bacterium]|nr:hypothetical protein [bacterium]
MNRRFATIPLVIVLVIIFVGGVGYWMWTQKSNTSGISETTEVPAQQNTQVSTKLVIRGFYSLRPASGGYHQFMSASDLKYLGFHLYAEGPSNPLEDVTTLFFNDEPSKPGNLLAPSGSSFGAIVADLRPLTSDEGSCDLEIDVTVEIKNPVFETRSEEGIGNYKVVSGDFVRVIKRGQVFDVCAMDNENGGTSYARTPRVL